MRRESNQVDSQAMIEMCLNCPWDECIDCLGAKNRYGYAIRLWFELHMEYDPKAIEKIRRLKCTKN